MGEEVTRNGDLKMWSVISSVSTFDNTGLVLVLVLIKNLAETAFGYSLKKLPYQSGTGIRFKAGFPWYMAGMYLVLPQVPY